MESQFASETPIDTHIYAVEKLKFRKWLRKSGDPIEIPEADRLLFVIADAGSVGLTRQQLGAQIDLPRHVLDDLLSALSQLGQISVANQGGWVVYRRPPYLTPTSIL